MSLISVIVPAYNSEKTITLCINSILSQTFSAFELILIDDGSTDKTPTLCEEFAQKDSRVRVVHKKNGGVSSARNLGLDLAKGPYIVFVDCDDTIDPAYLEVLFNNHKFDFVTAGFQTQGPDSHWYEQRFSEDYADQKEVSSHPSKYMGKYYFGAPWAKMYKKEIVDAHNIRFPLDVHNGEDTIFIFDYLMHTSTVKIVPYCGYNYFFYKTSLAHRISVDNFKWRIKVEKCVADFFKPCNEEEQTWLNNRCFDVLVGQVREHYPHLSREDIYSLYSNEIFKKCIAVKKKHGKLMDRIFIFTMEHRCYEIYLKLFRMGLLGTRIKNKIKRTLFGPRGHRNV